MKLEISVPSSSNWDPQLGPWLGRVMWSTRSSLLQMEKNVASTPSRADTALVVTEASLTLHRLTLLEMKKR